MGENSHIEWTHHTFNPWIGCTKVSAGCDHCYAETLDHHRFGAGHWGAGADRRLMSDGYWRQPFTWDRKAQRDGVRARVFCASLADVFDAEAPPGQRERLWDVIRQTPNLDWLLLTKRPHLIRRYLPADWGTGYGNVWLMTSVEDQKAADERIPWLVEVPAVVRGLSMEPLLGSVEFSDATRRSDWRQQLGKRALDGIHWVIVGGESGPGARPMHPDWARSIRNQCAAVGVPFFFKQAGSTLAAEWGCRDKKGGVLTEWPEDLQIREFPGNGHDGFGDR